MPIPLKVVALRVADADEARWRQAARIHRVSFSEWARNTLNAGCEVPVVLSEPPAPVRRLPPKVRVAPASEAECLNRVRPGSYCKRCGGIHQ